MNKIEATGELFFMFGEGQTAVEELTEVSPEILFIEAAQKGDREAFGKLYRLYARMIHGILLARVPRDEVDDLVQDVFLRAFEKIHNLRDKQAFGGWLAMIARNQAADFHRRTREVEEISEDVPQESTRQKEADQVLAFIQLLPEAYREILILRLVEGMTGPEIAARTNLTAGSVRVNLHRGMKMLREKLSR